jgi:hypothetical protein
MAPPLSITFTGTYFSTQLACDNLQQVILSNGDPDGWKCLRVGTYREYSALSSASVKFQSILNGSHFATGVATGTATNVAPLVIASPAGDAAGWTDSQVLPSNP